MYRNYSVESLPGEQWETRDGLEGYLISNYGRVKSKRRGRWKIIRQQMDRKGYLRVELVDGLLPRSFSVHRLVASLFVYNSNPKSFTQINHKDECKSNNRADNLEWCDSYYNNHYGTKSQRMSMTLLNHKGESKRVVQMSIDGEIIKEWPSISETGRNGFHLTGVSKCCNGIIRHYRGYLWKFA